VTSTAETIWEAFASKVVLRVTERAGLDRARAAAERELNAIDRACSRFRVDSEITKVNANAGRAVHVSPLLMEALALALRAAETTAGDVDATIGAALALAGYDRDWRLLDSPGTVQPTSQTPGAPPNALSSTADAPGAPPDARITSRPPAAIRVARGWRRVVLDRERGTVRMPAGAMLDLGATAKSWAADRAARAAAEAGECGALVAIGGDIAVSGPAPERGWLIRVTDDHRSDERAPGQTVSIVSGGLATSSTSVRRWSHAGRARHHILDPATGEPAPGFWRTVSAAAASCADANIATTASIVRGQQALAWLRALGLPARLVEGNGRVHTVGDWPEARPTASRSRQSPPTPRSQRTQPAPPRQHIQPAHGQQRTQPAPPRRDTRSRRMAAQAMAAHATAARASAAQAQEIVR
jgi:FAD:protein FMN transferase